MSTLKNLNNTHLTDEQAEGITTALTNLETNLSTILVNLSNDERRKYGSISEQNKLFVNKVHDYAQRQPSLCSPDVDWEEYNNDFKSRSSLEGYISRLQNVMDGLINAKILHDHDNYQAALDDYAYTKYKAGTSSVGFQEKQEGLKQFFYKSRNENTIETE